MLDARGVVLRVHYKSMKCDVLFSQLSIRTIFRWDGHFSNLSKNFFPLCNSAKVIKINWDYPKLWSQMYCYLFMIHSVHANSDYLLVVNARIHTGECTHSHSIQVDIYCMKLSVILIFCCWMSVTVTYVIAITVCMWLFTHAHVYVMVWKCRHFSWRKD